VNSLPSAVSTRVRASSARSAATNQTAAQLLLLPIPNVSPKEFTPTSAQTEPAPLSTAETGAKEQLPTHGTATWPPLPMPPVSVLLLAQKILIVLLPTAQLTDLFAKPSL
jgi:hypothetical protein